MNLFLTQFFISLSCILLFISIGFLVSKIFDLKLSLNPKYTTIYVLIGMLLTISGTAIYVTKGKTILFPIFFLTLLFSKIFNSYVKEIKNEQIIKPKWSSIIGYCLMGLIVNSWIYILLFKNNFFNTDYVFYSRIANYINYHGIETNTIEFFDKSVLSPTIYHYGDIWLSVFISKIYNISNIISINYIIPTILSTLSSLVLFLLFSKTSKIKSLSSIIFLLFGFLGGFFSFLPASLLRGDNMMISINSSSFIKLYVVVFILIILYYFFIHRRYTLILVLSSILSLVYLPIFPVLIISSLILLFFIKIKNIGLKFFVIIPIITLFYFFIFYSKFGVDPFDYCLKISFVNEIFQYGFFKYLLLFIKIIIVCGFQVILFLIPLLLLHKFYFSEPLKVFVFKNIFFISLSIIGILFYAFYTLHDINAVQFFNNIFIPSISIQTALILNNILEQKMGFQKKIIVIIFLLFSIIPTFYSTLSFFYKNPCNVISENELNHFINNKKSFSYVYNKPIEDYGNVFAKNSRVYQPINLYGNSNLIDNGVSLDIFNLSDKEKFEPSIIKSQPLYYYKIKNNIQNIDSLKLKYIKENDIKYYVRIKDAAIEPILNGKLTDSLILKNQNMVIYKLVNIYE
jgi:hypothetical protein